MINNLMRSNMVNKTDNTFTLTEETFEGFRRLIYEVAGINLPSSKQTLVAGRLRQRIKSLDLNGYQEYYTLLTSAKGRFNGEIQIFINLLTTNETYFFREGQHFDYLTSEVLPNIERNRPFRIWSSASSSGEEPYSVAMLLADKLGFTGSWEVHATDISKAVLTHAEAGCYSANGIKGVSPDYQRRFLKKVVKSGDTYYEIIPELKRRVKFVHYNLVTSPRPSPLFDIILCRNVLIYFDVETKQRVVDRLTDNLQVNGLLFTGRSETLSTIKSDLKMVQPSIYKKAS